MATRRSIWHIECGPGAPACGCGMALAQAHTTCGHLSRESARDGVRALKMAGWTRAHVVRGQCPHDREWLLRAESEAQVPSTSAVLAKEGV